jgi:hypothetical protein
MLVKKIKLQGNLKTKQLAQIKEKLKASDEASVVGIGVSCDAVNIGCSYKNHANSWEAIHRRVRRRYFNKNS